MRFLLKQLVIISLTVSIILLFSFSSKLKAVLQPKIFTSNQFSYKYLNDKVNTQFIIVHNDFTKRFAKEPSGSLYQYMWWLFNDSEVITIEIPETKEYLTITFSKKNIGYPICLLDVKLCQQNGMRYEKKNDFVLIYFSKQLLIFDEKSNIYITLPIKYKKYINLN
jgi:hypothetical protein